MQYSKLERSLAYTAGVKMHLVMTAWVMRHSFKNYIIRIDRQADYPNPNCVALKRNYTTHDLSEHPSLLITKTEQGFSLYTYFDDKKAFCQVQFVHPNKQRLQKILGKIYNLSRRQVCLESNLYEDQHGNLKMVGH